MYYWKHGRRGSGIHWLQQAHDEVRLNRIAQQLFECIGKSISDDSFKVQYFIIQSIWHFMINIINEQAMLKNSGLGFC